MSQSIEYHRTRLDEGWGKLRVRFYRGSSPERHVVLATDFKQINRLE